MVKYVDKITGELVSALENAKIRNNTLIIWTTDNGSTRSIEGEYKGRKVRGGKMHTTEPGISTPFIASWPDQVKSNYESDALIDFSDLFPTFLDLAGLKPQEKWPVGDQSHAIDGQSFKAVLLANTQESNRDWILSMGGGNHASLTENGVENQYVFRDRVLRNKQYKLYVSSSRSPEKFFDLLDDPFEEHNLLDSLTNTHQKENFDHLMEVLKSFPSKDNDPKYKPNSAQDWDVAITAQSQVWKK